MGKSRRPDPERAAETGQNPKNRKERQGRTADCGGPGGSFKIKGTEGR
ncbi:hypothetical protein B4135_0405 [Caldibacillus debilis]|uniref:Uncharacterized protein n=1 Tax=Caldibacillus debilis TaxID=301148 RepID=A0A150L8V3_9BACI|nr:hypothetical protein B4135_0405 [Caldibacillus debilis]